MELCGLRTLWFDTGTLCNLACTTCYIESSPRDDALVNLTPGEVTAFLDEIGLTGGEPFMNPDIIAILRLCLARGFGVLVLTNAMQPMRRFAADLLALEGRERLIIRVSLDHHTRTVHEAERGASWGKALSGIGWLAEHGFGLAIAGRCLPGENEVAARARYRALFADKGIPVDADDPAALVLFPSMDPAADVPEISEACWGILGAAPDAMMCASSRLVVRRKGEGAARVVACTLLPYSPGFDMGASLAEAGGPAALNHPHGARFCVLGGASCSA